MYTCLVVVVCTASSSWQYTGVVRQHRALSRVAGHVRLWVLHTTAFFCAAMAPFHIGIG